MTRKAPRAVVPSSGEPRLAFGGQEVADALGVSRELVKHMIRTGDLPSAKLGRRRVVTPKGAACALAEISHEDRHQTVAIGGGKPTGCSGQGEPHMTVSTAGRAGEKLTIAQICADLAISRRTFYEWRAKGRAPKCIRLPNGALRLLGCRRPSGPGRLAQPDGSWPPGRHTRRVPEMRRRP
jgi:excisionase family DNA binding protein